MMRYLLLLAAFCTCHAAPAQLLNRLKEKAAGAVQSAGMNTGDKARQTARDRAGAATDNAAAERKTTKQAIVFSKTPFAAGQTTGTATDFASTDNIYARVVMPTTIYDFLAQQGKEDQPEVEMLVYLSVDDNGSVYNSLMYKIPQADFKKPYYDLDILPAPGNVHTQYVPRTALRDTPGTLFQYFGAAAPSPSMAFGRQRINIEFGNNSGLDGSFTMTVQNQAEKKALAARVEAIMKSQELAAAKTTRLPDVFKTPGHFADPQLSAAAIKQKLGAGTVRFAVEPGSADYEIHKNTLGVPEYKITRAIWTVEKAKDGSCYFTRYYFRREYEGGGKYGPLDFASTTADKTPIACENVK